MIVFNIGDENELLIFRKLYKEFSFKFVNLLHRVIIIYYRRVGYGKGRT